MHVPGVLSKEWIKYIREVSDWQVQNPHALAFPGVVSNFYDYV